MPSQEMQQFIDLYISETEELIQKLNDDLLAYEKDPSQTDLLDSLMRSAHTIKGASNTMEFSQIGELTHALEDLFDNARKNNQPLAKETIDIILAIFDTIKDSINQIKSTKTEPDLSAYIEEVKKLTPSNSTPTPAPQKDKPAPPQPTLQPTPKFQSKPAPKPEPQPEISYIKVPVKRLDDLLNITQELLIRNLTLTEIVESITKASNLQTDQLAPGITEIPKLRTITENINKLSADLRYHVMKSRLVPLEQIFARFPRMIRDLAAQQEKQIEFKVSGSDQELDRTIIERLADPLVHILRNAVDHGIQKSGTISISAKRDKENVIIEIEDDGQGIEWKKVIKKALEKGLISNEEYSRFDNQLENITSIPPSDFAIIKDLLFHPQMSTNEKITNISGRGVGLDVVKEFVNDLNGEVWIKSPVTNTGTKFSLKLPLSIATINSLLVQAADTTYAIPFSSINRTTTITRKTVKTIGNMKTAIIEKTSVPLINLSQYLNSTPLPEESEKEDTPDDTIVIIEKDSKTIGLVVDKLIAEHEIIVKPLPDILRSNKFFSGSTILGDGRTVLILDTMAFINSKTK